MSATGKRVLVTGGSGYLGSHLLQRASVLRQLWEMHGTYLNHAPTGRSGTGCHSLDLTDEHAVCALVSSLAPDLVFHTAAVMGRDGLQPADSPGEAYPLNALGSGYLAKALDPHARLIHLSTDVIFDGAHAPYDENSPPHPIHRYGASKAAAESVIAHHHPYGVSVRTSLIYGFDPCDPRTRAVLEGRMPHLFVDEFRNPIWVRDLADALIELADLDYIGVLNIAGPERISRFEFGRTLLQALGGDPAAISPTSAAESDLVRPRDCTLDISRAQSLLHTPLHTVGEALALR